MKALSLSRRLFLPVLFSACAASLLSADEKFQWRGEVDGKDEIEIRGDQVRVKHLEAGPIQRQDHRFSSPLPRRNVNLTLDKKEGRGKVRLVQRPSSSNNYTAVVQIDDNKSGSDFYEFELHWKDDDWGDDDWDRDSHGSDGWRSSSSSSFDDDGGSFRWSGSVDIGAEIEIHGRSHKVKDMGGSGTRERTFRFNGSLPSSDVPVSVRKTKGRGKVRLVQSPSRSNGYVAVVSIEDDKGGSDNYEFELTWRD